MAPKKKNQGAKSKGNMVRALDLSDKSFDPMAGLEDSPEKEITSNKRSYARIEQEDTQEDQSESLVSISNADNDEDEVDSLEGHIFASPQAKGQAKTTPTSIPLNSNSNSSISTTFTSSSKSTPRTNESAPTPHLLQETDIIHISTPVNLKDLKIGMVNIIYSSLSN